MIDKDKWRKRVEDAYDDLDEKLEELEEDIEETERGPDFEYPFSQGDDAMNVEVTDTHVRVLFGLAGFPKEQLSVQSRDDVVTVQADASHNDDLESRELRKELPYAVDESGGSATYENGLLTVELPRVDRDDDDERHGLSIDD